MTRKQRTAVYIIVPVIIFIITFSVYYPQTFNKNRDIYTHMNLSLSLDRLLEVSHCGWHLVCWMFHALLPLPIEQAAAAATGFFNAMSAVVVLWMCERFFAAKTVKNCSSTDSRISPLAGRRSIFGKTVPTAGSTYGVAGENTTGIGPLAASLMTLAVLLVGPLYMRFYNPQYYRGQGTPNIWHNPTSIAARTTMLLIGVLTVDYWNCDPEERVGVWAPLDQTEGSRSGFLANGIRKVTAYRIALGLLLFFSTLAKPSYLMAYAPAVFIFLVVRLIKGRGRNVLQIIRDNLYFIPALLLFLSQYIRIYIFGGALKKESSVVIAWFKAAGKYAPNIGVSLVLRMAFPLLVILLWWKYIYKDRLFQLVGLQYVVAVLISWAFTEAGARSGAGNFGWGNMLCSSYLWIWCLLFFFREWKEEGSLQGKTLAVKLRFLIPLALLIWHLTAGIISIPSYMK